LQGEDLRSRAEQWCDQFAIAVIAKGFESDEDEIDGADLVATPGALHLWQGKIPIDGKNLQSVFADGGVITAQEKMDILAAALQQCSVIKAEGPGADYGNPHRITSLLSFVMTGIAWEYSCISQGVTMTGVMVFAALQ